MDEVQVVKIGNYTFEVQLCGDVPCGDLNLVLAGTEREVGYLKVMCKQPDEAERVPDDPEEIDTLLREAGLDPVQIEAEVTALIAEATRNRGLECSVLVSGLVRAGKVNGKDANIVEWYWKRLRV